MPIEELENLKKSLDGVRGVSTRVEGFGAENRNSPSGAAFSQEIDTMQNSIVSLKYAQAKYEESSESLGAIKPENEGKAHRPSDPPQQQN